MRRNGLLVAGGVLAVAVALSLSGTLVWLRSARVQQARATVEVRQQTTPSAEPAATPGEPGPKPAEESVRPSFDLARVEPSGEAVFAGRARPGAAVELADNGRTVGKAVAGPEGEWAIVPERPLVRGDHLVTLRTASPDGAETPSAQSLAVGILDGKAPFVVLAEADAPSRVLQASPEPPARSTAVEAPQRPIEAGPAASPAEAKPKTDLAIESVDYEEDGRLHVAGRAERGARLRAYVNDASVGEGAAADARFAFSLDARLPPGRHSIRVDQVEPGTGFVVGRVEARFEREAPAEPHEPQVVTIRQGDSLWKIARGQYGRGKRYTTIYRANTEQIRSPHRIYPNQVFVLPLDGSR